MTRRQRIPKERMSAMLDEDRQADIELERSLFGEERRLTVRAPHAERLRLASIAWQEAKRGRPGLRIRDWLAEQGLPASPYAYLRLDEDEPNDLFRNVLTRPTVSRAGQATTYARNGHHPTPGGTR